MKPPVYDQTGIRMNYVEAEMHDIRVWNAATIPKIREAVLKLHVTAMRSDGLPREAVIFQPTQDEVEAVASMTLDAFQQGRVIDFGYLPNEVMKQGGHRGGPLYSMGALGLPFVKPWVLFHTWEGGPAAYLINPMGDGPIAADVEICELHPVHFRNNEVLLIADRCMLEPGIADPEDRERYAVRVAPFPMRFIPELAVLNQGGTPEQAASGNCLDPLMTALLILSTRNIERETIEAPEKLNKARAKSKKPPIPPYDRVHTEPYVTAILARKDQKIRGEHQGGTHASPTYHLRLGHPRWFKADRYKEKRGKMTFIADTLVNASEEARQAFRAGRSHYALRGGVKLD